MFEIENNLAALRIVTSNLEPVVEACKACNRKHWVNWNKEDGTFTVEIAPVNFSSAWLEKYGDLVVTDYGQVSYIGGKLELADLAGEAIVIENPTFEQIYLAYKLMGVKDVKIW